MQNHNRQHGKTKNPRKQEPLRILVVTHAPLLPEVGAGQMALNLAEAFRQQGHAVTCWSPHPMQASTHWWAELQNWQFMRLKLDEFLNTQNSFDVIDCYPLLLTRRVAESGCAIARSVQPDILYRLSEIQNSQCNGFKAIALKVFHSFLILPYLSLLLQSWRRANYIFCLGSIELEWMKKWFPWWMSKLVSYNNALSHQEQIQLAEIRSCRQRREGEGCRFLWIGRWTHHKGITELIEFIQKHIPLNPKDTFTIAGCGTYAEKYFPSRFLQSGNIRMISSFERNQLYPLLENHDIGLFTSRVEGWGLVLNEMLESGMPIFATRAGGVTDLSVFFPDMIKPFPPQSDGVIDITSCSNKTDMKDYYQVFSWLTIAENYIKEVI